MRYRRLFGLPSGRRYVRRVQRSGARRDDQGFAFTRREWRYWHLRARIQLSDKSRLERYLDRRPGLFGGASIEDDWPARPYLLIRLTRDREAHERALRRIYPHRLRTLVVTYPEAYLREVADAIDPDALEAEGFDVSSWGPDISLNRVFVQMISARADHQAYFRARYGPAVTTFAAPEATRLNCTRLRRARVSSTGRSLVLHWVHSSGDAFETVEVTEHHDRVEFGIVLRVPYFGGPDDARPDSTRVRLSRPLGDRRVIDAATGRPVPASPLFAPRAAAPAFGRGS
jgi:hypothetical protein